ncbi:cytochrome b5 [Wallemia mellicola]|nr:cytochrome b5 [Wallemia mellicola]
MTENKKYTIEDLKQHQSNEDMWLLINGKVYDCTKFLDEHPGGDEVIISEGGKDATEAFDDIGHSDEARSQLDSLYIGKFDGPSKVSSSSQTGTKSSDTRASLLSNILFPLVAISAYLIWRIYFAN